MITPTTRMQLTAVATATVGTVACLAMATLGLGRLAAAPAVLTLASLAWLARLVTAATPTADRTAAGAEVARIPDDVPPAEIPLDPAASVARVVTDATRRTLALSTRLLDDIATIQRSEEDPGRLQALYGIDNLAMRLRRQAENMLVLTDEAAAGDPDEAPMRAVDVLRFAASETEGYTRVDVVPGTPVSVVGWASRPLAQLMAALIDNALQFSPPDTTVWTGITADSHGVTISIRDEGIGMTADALVTANAVLADPPPFHAAGSRSLGFVVAGTLARRLGTPVRLDPAGPDRPGLVATVIVPAALTTASAGQPPTLSVVRDDAPLTTTAGEPSAAPVGDWPPIPLPQSAPTAARLPDVQRAPVEPMRAFDPMADIPDLAAIQAALGGLDDSEMAAWAGPAAPSTPDLGEEAAPQTVGEADHGSGRRPSRRLFGSRHARPTGAGAWSTSLGTDATTPLATVNGPDVSFVNDLSATAPASVSTPSAAAPAVAPAPYLSAAPSFVAEPTRATDVPLAPAAPEDYVPDVVEDPLLDLLPDHPSAEVRHLTSPLSSAALSALEVPPTLGGIQFGGEPATTALPSRSAAPPPERVSATRLFAELSDDISDLGDGFDAIADLVASDTESAS